jgi:hypothetical protein
LKCLAGIFNSFLVGISESELASNRQH